MSLVQPDSLSQTIDQISEHLFFQRTIAESEKTEAAMWIASRQGLPRSYRRMFAPFHGEFKTGVALFTGEKVKSGAGISHCLGEEALRVLNMLDVQTGKVVDAKARAEAGFVEMLGDPRRSKGTFCCAQCSVLYLRHLASATFSFANEELTTGIEVISRHRTPDGKWGRYPFYQILQLLDEINPQLAHKEIQHAAPACERLVKRTAKPDAFSLRRRAIAERILARA